MADQSKKYHKNLGEPLPLEWNVTEDRHRNNERLSENRSREEPQQQTGWRILPKIEKIRDATKKVMSKRFWLKLKWKF